MSSQDIMFAAAYSPELELAAWCPPQVSVHETTGDGGPTRWKSGDTNRKFSNRRFSPERAVYRRLSPFIAVYRRLSPFGIAVFRRVGSPIGADRRRFSPRGISDLPGVPRLPGLFAAWDLRSIK